MIMLDSVHVQSRPADVEVVAESFQDVWADEYKMRASPIFDGNRAAELTECCELHPFLCGAHRAVAGRGEREAFWSKSAPQLVRNNVAPQVPRVDYGLAVHTAHAHTQVGFIGVMTVR